MERPVIAIPYLLDKEHLFQHIDPEANGFNSFKTIPLSNKRWKSVGFD